MKKFSVFVSIAMVLFLLSSCNNGSYKTGYADGYSDAESEMQHLLEEEYLEGYDEAKDQYGNYAELEYQGVLYARKYSSWHPEEAMMVIDAYQNNEPFWKDGSSPSYEEYLDAIESLYRFYEYFYCAMYKQ